MNCADNKLLKVLLTKITLPLFCERTRRCAAAGYDLKLLLSTIESQDLKKLSPPYVCGGMHAFIVRCNVISPNRTVAATQCHGSSDSFHLFTNIHNNI